MKKPTIKQKDIEGVVTKIAKHYKPEKIYLFGSFAWGKPNYDSDVDLFIVKNTDKDRLNRDIEVQRIIKGVLPVDSLVYTPKEVAKRLDLGDFFVQDIINKGKLIYSI
ncbi:nucleotidyltransferase domain-containing protein [Candidatus Gribaldobacteria bacterium]|nr:nucleotidyltransferase domain-containing protein [Candidatus Gribaldobacteria bacterium]